MHWSVASVAIVILGLVRAVPGHAQVDDSANKHVLAGLRGLDRVDVRLTLTGDVRPPFDRDQLQTAVELQVRKAGIRILGDSPGGAWLGVDVNIVRPREADLFATSIQVTLRQPVSLLRDPQIVTYATTWYTGLTGLYGRGTIGTIVPQLLSRIDEFTNSFLAANPK